MATCKACNHPQHDEINKAMINGIPLRSLHATYSISLGALHRHKQHVKVLVQKAIAAREGKDAEHSSKLVTQLEEVIVVAKKLLGHAARSGQFSAANGALANIIRCSELMARASGELTMFAPGGASVHFHSNRTVNINVTNDDREIAMLIAEATNNYDPSEIHRLKMLAQSNEKPALTITNDSQSE